MKVLTGVDIVEVTEFRKAVRNGGQTFLNRIFSPSEQKNGDIVHLAGVFAAKEAVVKALSLPAGKWLEIEIKNRADGRPMVVLPKHLSEDLKSFDLSISHSEKNAIAFFAVLKLLPEPPIT